MTPSPSRDAWMKAREAESSYRLMREFRDTILFDCYERLTRRTAQMPIVSYWRVSSSDWVRKRRKEYFSRLESHAVRHVNNRQKISIESGSQTADRKGANWHTTSIAQITRRQIRRDGRSCVIDVSKRLSVMRRCRATKRDQIKSSRGNSAIFIVRTPSKLRTSQQRRA